MYRHTSPDGKAYVGCTGDTLQHRWRGGHGYVTNSRFFSDIQKYGWSEFDHEILYVCESKEDAEKKEAELIARYDLTNPEKGYNIDPGLGVRSAQTIAKISKAHTGVPLSVERRKRMSARQTGKLWPEDRKQRMSQNHKQNQKVQAHILTLNATRKGAPKTEAHRKKIAENQPRRRTVINLDTGVIYGSVHEAAVSCGGDHPNIIKVCNKERRTAYGFRWAYGGGEQDATTER